MKTKRNSPEHTRVLRQTLTQLFELQMQAGASEADVSKLTQECLLEAGNNSRNPKTSDEVFDAQDYGSVLKSWHRQGQYLSTDGFPRPLSINGKNGLRRLVEKYYPKGRFIPILNSLRESGLIREQPDGKWTPTARNAVFPILNTELLTHLTEGVSRLIDTVTRNVTAKTKEEAMFERSTKVRTLPDSDAIAFRQFVRSQGSAFLGAIDDWLEARAESAKKSRGKKCTAGVFTFAFLDYTTEGPSEARPRTRRRRKTD